ncbi:hypothetical protein B0T24DRAFT_386004 [Lasiosphaeria ovina]|uniref:HD domain-containing protein n=1 Tax=Lasiosphaeria ovina TaxID=92902 RepID=A0AAE0N205_9PEZI|nr:hypothetical protein B0T24DRAFT_386004 [Lasiosphaeria ovina]
MLAPTLFSSYLLLLPLLLTLTNAAPPSSPSKSLPHRTLANISVVDTPIVRAAEAYAKQHSPGSYNHVMRAWLFGCLHLSHNATLAAQVDLEVHAIGLMLHDLASDHPLANAFVTRDRRFEVDSAAAAANFIRSHADAKRNWPGWRVQRVWDGIALHAEPRFALHKEPDVLAIYWGNELEFSWAAPGGGEQKGVTRDEHEAVLRAFPRDEGRGAAASTGLLAFAAWYCRYKPESTYDMWMQPYGELLVPGYSAAGHRLLDRALAVAGVDVSTIGV